MEQHKVTCQANYPDTASIYLESKLATVIVKEAFKGGIIFSEIICDGDDNSIETLNVKRYIRI